mgnify:CR=1 FL=1
MVPVFFPEGRIIGNRVRIPGSTRCCVLHIFQNNPATVNFHEDKAEGSTFAKAPVDTMGRRSEKKLARRPAIMSVCSGLNIIKFHFEIINQLYLTGLLSLYDCYSSEKRICITIRYS